MLRLRQKAVKYVATPSQPSPAPPSWAGSPMSGKDDERRI